MKIVVNHEIGFSDAEIVSFVRESQTLVVKLLTWNEQILSITFNDAVGICDYGLGDISALVEETDAIPLLKSALENVYERVPANQPYHVYEFLNLDDNPRLQIVAKSISFS